MPRLSLTVCICPGQKIRCSLRSGSALSKLPAPYMKMFICNTLPAARKYLLLTGILFTQLDGNSQYYEEKPEPEIAIGMKAISGQIIYGPKSFYKTTSGGVSIQPMVRYERPLKIYSRSPYQNLYIGFVLQGGFLFCKAKEFDSVFIDRTNNTIIRDRSFNTTYLPVYAGLYSKSVFCVGAEIFYWKGFGARDIWGTKFLSLGYNAKHFRAMISGEWYAQTKNSKHSGTVLSVDITWKLFVDDN